MPSQDDAKAGKVIISIRDGARGGGMVVSYDVEWTGGVAFCLVAAWLRRRGTRIWCPPVPAHDVSCPRLTLEYGGNWQNKAEDTHI